MSDSAFTAPPYSGYTTSELALMAETRPLCIPMLDELNRRERIRAGDVSVMYPGKRLNFVRKAQS